MKYSSDEFFRLVDEVSRQGGVHLDETHDRVFHTKLTGKEVAGAEVVYCGEAALFEVPYDEGDAVKVCAVCDRIGLWPRNAAARAFGSGT